MNRGEHCMLQRTRTVDGVEGVATPEYFNALRAVNFITRQNMECREEEDDITRAELLDKVSK